MMTAVITITGCNKVTFASNLSKVWCLDHTHICPAC